MTAAQVAVIKREVRLTLNNGESSTRYFNTKKEMENYLFSLMKKLATKDKYIKGVVGVHVVVKNTNGVDEITSFVNVLNLARKIHESRKLTEASGLKGFLLRLFGKDQKSVRDVLFKEYKKARTELFRELK